MTTTFPVEQRGLPSLRDVHDLRRATNVRIDHPYDVRWYDDSIWVGTEGGLLLRVDVASGSPSVVADTGGNLLGLAPLDDGSWLACDQLGARVVRISPDGSSTTVLDRIDGAPFVRPDTLIADGHGGWLLSVAGVRGAHDGRVVRLTGDPATGPLMAEAVIDDAPGRPTGMALSPDGATLVVVESDGPTIARYSISGGAFADREIVHTFPVGHVPMGVAYDGAGFMYVACWRPDRIYRIDPAGTVEVFVDDPTALHLQGPTGICFAPDDGRMLIAMYAGRAVVELDMG